MAHSCGHKWQDFILFYGRVYIIYIFSLHPSVGTEAYFQNSFLKHLSFHGSVLQSFKLIHNRLLLLCTFIMHRVYRSGCYIKTIIDIVSLPLSLQSKMKYNKDAVSLPQNFLNLEMVFWQVSAAK